MTEKRRSVRWKVNLPVRYAGLNTPTEGACHTQDVSIHGALLAMVERHRPGDRLDMALEVPGEIQGTLCVEADVVWQRPSCNSQEECNYLTGVVFRQITDCHKKSLADYVSSAHPEEFRTHWWDGV